jgi:hypothetical protein
MDYGTWGRDQTEQDPLAHEVSDEALEAAVSGPLPMRTCTDQCVAMNSGYVTHSQGDDDVLTSGVSDEALDGRAALPLLTRHSALADRH